MAVDSTTTIIKFLDAAAARQPTPGGGSVTALAGALAASMAEMVLNYSLNRKTPGPHDKDLEAGLSECHRARELLLGLMNEDQIAFEAMTEARKMPPGQSRDEALNAAIVACIRVPQTVGATALAVLDSADRLVDAMNPNLLSDLAVCVDLSMATIRCATYNVMVNLKGLANPKDRESAQLTNAQLLQGGLNRVLRVSPRIWDRLSNAGLT